MAHKFPSEEWTVAYKDAVNGNEKYKVAGKDWTHGPVAMIIKANPAAGIAEDTGMVLDVDSGTCRGTRYIKGSEAADLANFVIVAEYEEWKKVIQREIDPIKAMMQGKLKLTKGHLPTIIKYVESSRQLVESAALVPTEFPV